MVSRNRVLVAVAGASLVACGIAQQSGDADAVAGAPSSAAQRASQACPAQRARRVLRARPAPPAAAARTRQGPAVAALAPKAAQRVMLALPAPRLITLPGV